MSWTMLSGPTLIPACLSQISRRTGVSPGPSTGSPGKGRDVFQPVGRRTTDPRKEREMKATTSGIETDGADWRRQRSGRFQVRPAGGIVPGTRANQPGNLTQSHRHKEGM